ncbi:MAG: hypothetical protein VW917_04290, partial [Pontimonas sp.]
MAVESTGNLIGYQLPAWELPDRDGAHHQVREEGHRATLVAFVCNHCPYVQHVEQAFGDMVSSFAPQGLRTIAVV